MKINYELTKADYIKFNFYLSKNSEDIKKKLFKKKLVPSLIIFFLGVVCIVSSGFFGGNALKALGGIYFVLSILLYLFMPRFFEKSIIKNVNILFEKGKNKNFLGKHSVAISKDYVLETNESAENKITWDMVKKIEESDLHILIYVNELSAYMIPINAFENEKEKSDFLELAIKYKNQIEK